MTFQDLYPGQRVRILSWDELKSIGYYDGIGVHLPDTTFFHKKMKYLCGTTLTIVDEPHCFDSDEDYLSPDIFQFDDPLLSFSYNIPSTFGFQDWLLSTAMLAPLNESPSAIPPAISFDQLITGGEPSQ